LHPDLAIDLSIAPDLPRARGDGALLEQVLFNLLDNARKYGGAGQPVAIYVREDEGMLSISVTDQGKGIPEVDLERIFDKFYRRTRGDGRPAGTGLGLSIARGLMTAMGGTITATSPAIRKRGTRFTLRLPLAAREV
jgi:two-component system sensor histidine kinase KdpD